MWTASGGRELGSGFIPPRSTGCPPQYARARAWRRYAGAARRSWWWRTTTSCAAPSSGVSRRPGPRSSRRRTGSRRSRRCVRRRASAWCSRTSLCRDWGDVRCTTPRGGRATPRRSYSPAVTPTPIAPRLWTRRSRCSTSRGRSRVCWGESEASWIANRRTGDARPSPDGRSPIAPLAVEHLPHLAGQAVRHEGLLEERDAGVQHALAYHRIVGIARRVEHLHAGPLGRQALGELAAAHAGHHDIGHKDIDPAVGAGGELQRRRPVGCLADPGAPPLLAPPAAR